MRSPTARAFSTSPSRSIASSTASAAAAIGGEPPNVVAWSPRSKPASGRVRGEQRADRQPAREALGDGGRIGPDARELLRRTTRRSGRCPSAPRRTGAARRGGRRARARARARRRRSATRRPRPGSARRARRRSRGRRRRASAARSLRGTCSKPAGHGLERLALGGRPAGRERRQRATVEGALDAHDAVLGRPAARAPVAARELDGGLDRLGARVAEERAVLARERAQALGERDRRLAVEEVRDVAEHGRLRGERLRGRRDGRARASRRRARRRGRGRRCRPRPRRCSRRRARASSGRSG